LSAGSIGKESFRGLEKRKSAKQTNLITAHKEKIFVDFFQIHFYLQIAPVYGRRIFTERKGEL